MQLHNLSRKTQRKLKRYVGRGSKRGKTSGRGGKGQTARAGSKIRPEIRDMIKRLPKLRGRGKNLNTSAQQSFQPVNLSVIDKMFNAGEMVNAQSLAEKGLIRMVSGKFPKIKILATGEISKKLEFVGVATSMSAKAKIEKAGGKLVEFKTTKA